MGVHDNRSAVQRRIHLVHELMRHGFTLTIHIHGYFHGNTAVVISTKVRFHFGNIGVFDLLPNPAIRVKILNSTNRERFFYLLYGLDFLQILVIQRVLFQQVKELLPGIDLMEQREGRVKQGYFLAAQGKQFILLSTDIQGITQRQLVLLGNRRRRIHLIIGRHEGPCDLAAEFSQHGICPFRMMGLFLHNMPHGLQHNRKDEYFVVAKAGSFLTCSKSTPNTGHVVSIKLLFLVANLFPEIIVVVDDGTELIYQCMSLASVFHIPKILRIGLLFFGGKIAVSLDQLSDPLFNHRPFQDKLRVFLFIPGRKAVKTDALRVMILPNTATGDRIAITTGAIFLLQKCNVGFFGFVFLELLKNPQLSLRKTATTHQHIVNGGLGNIEAGAVLGLGVVDDLFLLCLGWQRLFVHIQPCVHKHHAFDA